MAAGMSFDDALESAGPLLMMFGFVDYHCSRHKVSGAKERVEVAVSVFRTLFGDTQGIRMFGALDRAFRERASKQERTGIDYTQEGFDAAKEAFGGHLVAEFLRGRLAFGSSSLFASRDSE